MIFPQNVTVFDASPQPEMRDMDEGKEAFEIFFFYPTTSRHDDDGDKINK